MTAHAFLSASGAPAWLLCPVKPWREKDIPESTSVYADEGIKAHDLLEYVLRNHGYLYPVRLADATKENPAAEYIETTLNMIEMIAANVPHDRELKVLSEQRLSISHITGEKGAKGTADVVILTAHEVVVIDLKYGKGIRVHAENNMQLLIYGAAALKKYGKGKKTLHMLISQPRLNHTSEWILSVAEVAEKIKFLNVKAKEILAAKGGENLLANPGTAQCQFCKVKTTCPERTSYMGTNPTVRRIKKQVEELIFSNLDDDEYIEAAIGLSLTKEEAK